jgi:hypothetical protein
VLCTCFVYCLRVCLLCVSRYVPSLELSQDDLDAYAALSEDALVAAHRSIAAFVREYVELRERSGREAAENVAYYMDRMPTRALWRDVALVALRNAADNTEASREKQRTFAEGVGPLLVLLRQR